MKKVTGLLEKAYGIPRLRRNRDLLGVLIQTILSQNTNDRNRDQAYERLRTRFPRWEDVLRVKRKGVVQAIRPGGLARQKAARIQEILLWIEKTHGRLSLDFLRRMDSQEIKKIMGRLKGIGPKTLHCLLLFGLGRNAFPVDTHVLRVGKRLGLFSEKVNADKAHALMEPLIPDGKALSLHINLIRHGRSICKAIRPKCEICFLMEECTYPDAPPPRSERLTRE